MGRNGGWLVVVGNAVLKPFSIALMHQHINFSINKLRPWHSDWKPNANTRWQLTSSGLSSSSSGICSFILCSRDFTSYAILIYYLLCYNTPFLKFEDFKRKEKLGRIKIMLLCFFFFRSHILNVMFLFLNVFQCQFSAMN